MTHRRNDEHQTRGKSDSTPNATRFDRCDECGDAIDAGRWHPLETATVDEEVHVYAFCSLDCREEWRARHEADS